VLNKTSLKEERIKSTGFYINSVSSFSHGHWQAWRKFFSSIVMPDL
jgi:hypothetical protein